MPLRDQKAIDQTDRDGNRKHHLQTLCAMGQLDYKQKATHDYSQLFQVIDELALEYPAKEEAFRRMVFNVLTHNRDDHVKNFAFRMTDEGNWELAPAYEVLLPTPRAPNRKKLPFGATVIRWNLALTMPPSFCAVKCRHGIQTCRVAWSGILAAALADLFDFIASFFNVNADFNGDGVTNSQDFFDFVTAFFVGC